jgi:FtsP/CotA-like multicopper oxidase with cupredoxin domain
MKSKQYSTALALLIGVLALVVMIPSAVFAVISPAYTPPGLNSINPPLQPDGIQVPDVFGSTPNWQFSPPLRKFVDSLAPLGCSPTNKNNLGQCIPVAVPDTTTFSGSDYYEIELNRYTEQLHSDLPPTTLQGYRQVNGPNGSNRTQHYLGPIIVAQKDRAVRIKFINNLPTESVEPFFLPVDTTVMGSGMGPLDAAGNACDPVYDPRLGQSKPNCAEYTKNRAELHLHGGLSPWISDGTPHQWITPAGETTVYPKGVNVQYVPDMWFDGSGNVIVACAGLTTCGVAGASNNPGPGAVTYYYTNQQSARLMFYHDHSFGITRLNVYAGEAAGYLIQDPTEASLTTAGIIPADQIPLVIEDKAFVDATPGVINTLDPTWVWGTGPRSISWVDITGAAIPGCDNLPACGTPGARKKIIRTPKAGDLWWPHVYMPAENPADLGGVNPMGRWVYGLYFWPPTTGIKFLPVDNPYYDCGVTGQCNSPWEPPVMPATPNPSWTAEAFLDTQTVNGTVFPKLDVQPKPYRLRILNASHDRFVNLQLYKADTSVNANLVNPLCTAQKPCALNTEVKMVPAVEYPAYPDWTPAADNRVGGVPDPATAGPKWIQIGNEGGFLPTPAIIYNKPISFVLDPTLFNVGNVNDGTLIMGPAERADVIIDFSAYAGQTLILYNDAPAAFPAFVPTNDYYTDSPDLTAVGGYPGTKAGTGPNTRTIMQINVAAGAGTPFNETALFNAFASSPGTPGVFQQSQHPVIVGQSAYDSAYNTAFPSVAPNWGFSAIGDNAMTFETVVDPLTVVKELALQYPMQPKALHDEMGAVWDEYGRMSAKLGVEIPNTNNINQIFVMQNYQDPPTELLQDGKIQLWKITHNGVDTHPLHFHLVDVQVINRVGWDGFIRKPWDNELGWKETVRVSPLEDTIVAMRPRSPIVPFVLQDSVRLYQPALPLNSPDGFMNLNPLDGQALISLNTSYNYGAEYVWHCHILSHEEQDMMRPLVFRVATAVSGDPTGLTINPTLDGNILSWTDNTYLVSTAPYNTTLGFTIERCDLGDTVACAAGPFAEIGRITMVSNNLPSYTDMNVLSNTTYTYRVTGYNTWIDNATLPAPTWHPGPADPLARSASLTLSQTSATWTPATGLTLTPSVPSPSAPPVKFTAAGSGSNRAYQYRFKLNGGIVQDYSSTTYWSLPAGTPVGTYTITADVRTDKTSLTPDQTVDISYEIRLTPPTNLTLTVDKPSPQAPSTQITFTATATGSTGYQFHFLVTDGGNPIAEQPYGPNNVWTWNTTGLPPSDTYVVRAEVRSSTSVPYDQFQEMWFDLDPLTPPGAPTIGTAVAGNGAALVSFTAPVADGHRPVTSYTVTSYPGGISTVGYASPVMLKGLINGISYTFTVKATNSIGTGTASALSNSVTPSLSTPPSAVITSTKPANPTNHTADILAFTGLNAAQFYCTFDSGPLKICSSPFSLTGLSEGVHNFTVYAVNAQAVVSAPASYTWTVDLTPPDTAIVSTPPLLTGISSATFTFNATPATGNTFECQRDGGGFTPCVSPKLFTGLTAGAHTFDVRAKDAALNIDATPASYTWTVDVTTAPTTTITPVSSPAKSPVTVTFSADSADATFMCKVDSGLYATCISPKILYLANGPHTFSVYSRRPTGTGTTFVTEVGAPAVAQSVPITIDALAPTVAITAKPALLANSLTANFTFSNPSADVNFDHYNYKVMKGVVVATAETSLGAGISTLAWDALADGAYTISVWAVDVVGNKSAVPATYAWTIDTTPPNTAIIAKPALLTGLTSATFTFTSTPATGNSFECQIDGGGFTACVSPKLLTGLTAAAHTFDVRAKDAALNVDPSAASYTWTIDTTSAAVTTITPVTSPAKSPVTMTFSADKTDATFMCKVDSGLYAACVSPKVLYLANGPHTFSVYSRRATGTGTTFVTEVGAPAGAPSTLFTVDTVAPTVAITAKPALLANSLAANFTFSNPSVDANFDHYNYKVMQGLAIVTAETSLGAGVNTLVWNALADGAYTITVWAVDVAGNKSAVPATYAWTIDATPPDTTIVAKPALLTGLTSATFTFTSTPATGNTFECQIDGGGFSACLSPKLLTGLTTAPHTFDVRAKDVALNVDPTPASYTWTVDTASAAVTTITPVTSPAKSPVTITFSADKTDATFMCKVDSGLYAACVSPRVLYLTNGPHSFSVYSRRATGTGATIVTEVGAPAGAPTVAFTIDAVVPTVAITAKPALLSNSLTANFTFSNPSTDINIDHYNYKVMQGAVVATAETSLGAGISTLAWNALADGIYTITAWAVDVAGNKSAAPATYTWTIDTTPPNTAIVAKPAAYTGLTTATFTFTSTPVTGNTYECQIDGGGFSACLSPKSYPALTNASHTFDVRAKDAALNVDLTPASYTWTVDTTPATTTILTGPAPGSLSKSSVTFTFSADKTDATFECKLDLGAYAACTTPKILTLASGSHLFSVRAKRMTGAGTGIATYEAVPPGIGWTVDAIVPSATIVTKPEAKINQPIADFVFSSLTPADVDHYNYKVMKGVAIVTAETSLGLGVSSVQLTGLTDGTYTISVWAVDAAGNKSASPATWMWTVALPPETSITGKVLLPSYTGLTSVLLSFTSPSSGVTFECSFDGSTYAACTAPLSYTSLANGVHTFAVRAKTAAGLVDPTPDSYTWTVDTVIPDATITVGPATNTLFPHISFTSSKVDATFECKLDAVAPAPSSGTYAVCASPSGMPQLTSGSTYTFTVRSKRIIGSGTGSVVYSETPAQVTWTVM